MLAEYVAETTPRVSDVTVSHGAVSYSILVESVAASGSRAVGVMVRVCVCVCVYNPVYAATK